MIFKGIFIEESSSIGVVIQINQEEEEGCHFFNKNFYRKRG